MAPRVSSSAHCRPKLVLDQCDHREQRKEPPAFKDWEGGIAYLDKRVLAFFDRSEAAYLHDPGDTVVIEGRSLLILANDYPRRCYKVMEDSPEAHRLLMWHLRHEVEESLFWIGLRALAECQY